MSLHFQNKIQEKTDKELIEIYIHSDQYQQAFVDFALNELKQRNIDLSAYAHIKTREEIKPIQFAGKEIAGDSVYIIIGYVSALLGGILSIIMGYYYSNSRHKIEGSKEYYVYDKNTRELGAGMMIIGCIAVVFYLTGFLPG